MAKRDKTVVMISADDLQTVCPYHGPVGEVAYEPVAVAPCGCQWYLLADDGLLHAVRVDSEAQERADSLRSLAT